MLVFFSYENHLVTYEKINENHFSFIRKNTQKIHTLVYIRQMIQSQEKNDVRIYFIQKSFSFIQKI